MIDLLVSIFVVFVIRRFQKSQSIPRFTNFCSKILILEDDFGRMVVAFLMIFILQIILRSPYTIHKQDESQIKILVTETNRLTISNEKLGSDNATLKTNNAYIHDQWTGSIATANNYLGQINDLNRKLQDYNSQTANFNSATNSNTSRISYSPSNTTPQSATPPTFDVFLNHKYVSNGAILPLDQKRILFFQVQNTGTEVISNLTVIFAAPLDETNFIFDAHWTKRPFAEWVAVNHQMLDVSGSVMMQISIQQPLQASQVFDVTSIGIAPSLKSSATSFARLASMGFGFPGKPDSAPDINPLLPVTVMLTINNTFLKQVNINLLF